MTTALARWFSIEPAQSATVDPAGARRANVKAKAALEAERSRIRETATSAAALRELRTRNHWAELLYDTMERP